MVHRRVELRVRGEAAVESADEVADAGSLCHAPDFQLHFLPNGDVKTCCMNAVPLGNVSESTLDELWNGQRLRSVRESLAAGSYGAGCQQCGVEIELEGRGGSLPESYDELRGESIDRGWLSDVWPVRMEFNLSNVCNLQCVQCNGELSSSIRRHRDHRPPLPMAFGEDFLTQLAIYLPHLRTAGFAGGEPFLEPLNFRVFELVAEHNPSLLCTVNTNGTVLNRRVRRVLAELDVNPILSLDAMSRDGFERIRLGASLDRVLANFADMREIVLARGGWLGINFCLLAGNAHELFPVLRFADSIGARVWVSVVQHPQQLSLMARPLSERQRAAEGMLKQHRGASLLSGSIGVWNRELARVCAMAGMSIERPK